VPLSVREPSVCSFDRGRQLISVDTGVKRVYVKCYCGSWRNGMASVDRRGNDGSEMTLFNREVGKLHDAMQVER